jgi:Asp-tRNA(Asn)/Glu-tRNA(Gln) amidotransferase A subunit family amidase
MARACIVLSLHIGQMTFHSKFMTALEMSDGLAAGRWTALELVRASIDQAIAIEPKLNAFVEIHTDEALAEAAASDQRRSSGEHLSPLDGIPIGVKDAIGVAGHTMIAGSGTTPALVHADAGIVLSLRRAGAVVLGRTRLHELAYGASGLNDFDGGARNPSYPERLTGGSSSGSAAAVAGGVCPIAVGTDTGGSIRVPATLCGVVGFKPTYALLPTDGVLVLAPTMDHVGLIARTIGDVALAMEAIKAISHPGESRPGPRRVGVINDPQMPAEPSIARAFDAAIAKLAAEGWDTEPLGLPSGYDVMELSTTIMSREAYQANRLRLEREADRLGPDVRERLESGASIAENTYRDALERRGQFREAISQMAERFDALVSPAIPMPAPSRADGARPEIRRRLVQNTRLQNLLGMPAITFPGAGEPEPWGIQLSALWGRDAELLATATAAYDVLGRGPS